MNFKNYSVKKKSYKTWLGILNIQDLFLEGLKINKWNKCHVLRSLRSEIKK